MLESRWMSEGCFLMYIIFTYHYVGCHGVCFYVCVVFYFSDYLLICRLISDQSTLQLLVSLQSDQWRVVTDRSLCFSMLFERRVLITSRKLSRLTACIHGAASLLYPMHWYGVTVVSWSLEPCPDSPVESVHM